MNCYKEFCQTSYVLTIKLDKNTFINYRHDSVLAIEDIYNYE